MKKITILSLCLSLFLVGSMSAQETVWVAAAPSGAANGTSEADAYGSLATALFDINSVGDVLKVVGTVTAGSHNLALTSATSVNKNFQYTIEGVGVGATLAGAPGLVRMFTINAASAGQDVTFKNITFSGSTGCTGTGGGGVLLSNQASVNITFENCRFVGNSLASAVTTGGGALNITNSTVTITDCLFKENQALQNGGAIAIYNTSNVTMTGCTFYKNSTTGTTQSFGGAALYVTGASAVVNIDHCTFFQNNIGHPNQDYGTIRSDNGNTTIKNSLFYGNKVTNITVNPPVLGGPSDWGVQGPTSAAAGIQTFSYSIGQWISSNIDFRTNFISFVKATTNPLEVAANLASSNLTYDDALGKVTYIAPTVAGENSPIDFGDDGADAGAWDSGLILSVKDNEFAANFSVSYNSQTKNIRVLRSNDDSTSLEIYNLMGSKVISLTNASKEENINASALQSGVYILVIKGSENKSFAKKLVIN
jgi:predicted outer membrane repeat protein